MLEKHSPPTYRDRSRGSQRTQIDAGPTLPTACNPWRKMVVYGLHIMSTEREKSSAELSEFIAENFGANATYVESLLARFRSDPALVDDAWRGYFEELIGENGAARVASPAPAPASAKSDGDAAAAAKSSTPRQAPATRAESSADTVPIRGPALKIVENMEASLTVPTATSQRRIPVKLLEENRRLINRHLADNDRGKASFTHLIAYAALRAIDEF